MTKMYYVSNYKMTCGVRVDNDGKVIATPPILKKFINQPFDDLVKWMKSQGPVVVSELK